MIPCLLSIVTQSHTDFHRTQHGVQLSNGLTSLQVNLSDGTFAISWGHSAAMTGCHGEIKLSSGTVIRTDLLARHSVAHSGVQRVHDRFGSGFKLTVEHRGSSAIRLAQTFSIYDGKPEVLMQIEADGHKMLRSNYVAPLVAKSAKLTNPTNLQDLFVPYDNDSYARFSSNGWGRNSSEVSAIYDDASRNGIVVGSIDHGVWKSGVCAARGAGITAFDGLSDKYTHDSLPHGSVTGTSIRSARFSVGFYSDWRSGMERYGRINAAVHPALPWTEGVPFGWSSWSGSKDKLKQKDGLAAIDFFENKVPELRSNGVAYLNLDSFWDNLKPKQIKDFVERAHAAKLKAGIYWTPFTAWGKLTDKLPGTKYLYGDLALKNEFNKPLPRLDGGAPLDPTHPGTLWRIDDQLAKFVGQGFDLVKLDFLTHGALEGRHFDRLVATGTQAYAIGMQRIVDDLSLKKVGRSMLICLSIAPLFPNGYGHTRRVSCDVFANIGATEYLLNSQNYGWWIDDTLYRYNDPDSACVYQPLGEPAVSMAESRSRLTASLIVSGMLIEGDNLTHPANCERAQKLFSNSEVLELAKRSLPFRPMSGHTGDKAGDVFYSTSADKQSVYVAVFNYSKSEATHLSLSTTALGLPDNGKWLVHEIWTGKDRTAGDQVDIALAPRDCTLLKLTREK